MRSQASVGEAQHRHFAEAGFGQVHGSRRCGYHLLSSTARKLSRSAVAAPLGPRLKLASIFGHSQAYR